VDLVNGQVDPARLRGANEMREELLQAVEKQMIYHPCQRFYSV